MLYVPVLFAMLLNGAISLKLFSILVCDNKEKFFENKNNIIEK